MRWEGLFGVAIGLFCIGGAALEWGFFMNHHKARLLISIFGRQGARAFYIALGLIISVCAVLFMFGIIKNST